MSALVDRIRLRLIPAVLTAVGIGLLAVGLLSYSNPVTAKPAATASPSPTLVADAATPSPLITLPPLESGPLPSSSATVAPVASLPVDHLVTRVRVAGLKIDLP